eukprot:Colp12_sorted_trinity150504_noHs@20095
MVSKQRVVLLGAVTFLTLLTVLSIWDSKLVKQHSFFGVLPSPEKEKYLIVDVQYGLGNRLRAYAYAKALAQKLRRKFIVVWAPDNHCQATWDDLFERDDTVLDSVPDSMLDPDIVDIYNFMETEPGGKKDQTVNVKSNKHIYLRTAYPVKSIYMRKMKADRILQRLRVKPEIEMEADKIFDVDDMIGIHIRMVAPDQKDVPGLSKNEYSDAAKAQMQAHRDACHYENFASKIREKLKTNPDQVFYISADNDDARSALKKEFGKHVVFQEGNCPDRTRECIQKALVDVLQLSRTRYIIGSNYSTFSELAASMGALETANGCAEVPKE